MLFAGLWLGVGSRSRPCRGWRCWSRGDACWSGARRRSLGGRFGCCCSFSHWPFRILSECDQCTAEFLLSVVSFACDPRVQIPDVPPAASVRKAKTFQASLGEDRDDELIQQCKTLFRPLYTSPHPVLPQRCLSSARSSLRKSVSHPMEPSPSRDE